MKSTAMDGEKIYEKHIPDRDQVSRIQKELSQLRRKQSNFLNGQKV